MTCCVPASLAVLSLPRDQAPPDQAGLNIARLPAPEAEGGGGAELGAWLFYPGLRHAHLASPAHTWRLHQPEAESESSYRALLLQVPNFGSSPGTQHTLDYFSDS